MEPSAEDKGHLKGKFEDFEFTPDDRVWNKIQAGDENRDRAGFLAVMFSGFTHRPRPVVWRRIAGELHGGLAAGWANFGQRAAAAVVLLAFLGGGYVWWQNGGEGGEVVPLADSNIGTEETPKSEGREKPEVIYKNGEIGLRYSGDSTYMGMDKVKDKKPSGEEGKGLLLVANSRKNRNKSGAGYSKSMAIELERGVEKLMKSDISLALENTGTRAPESLPLRQPARSIEDILADLPEAEELIAEVQPTIDTTQIVLHEIPRDPNLPDIETQPFTGGLLASNVGLVRGTNSVDAENYISSPTTGDFASFQEDLDPEDPGLYETPVIFSFDVRLPLRQRWYLDLGWNYTLLRIRSQEPDVSIRMNYTGPSVAAIYKFNKSKKYSFYGSLGLQSEWGVGFSNVNDGQREPYTGLNGTFPGLHSTSAGLGMDLKLVGDLFIFSQISARYYFHHGIPTLYTNRRAWPSVNVGLRYALF